MTDVWPSVRSIPVSAVTDAARPRKLRPLRIEQVAGAAGTGRDTAGGAAIGVGTKGARPAHARANPAAELGFSGDPEQHCADDTDMLHAQRTWDAALATNRLDLLGVTIERQRVETEDITASVSLLVDGRPDDLRACVESVIKHTRAKVLALDLGNVGGAGDVLRELAARHRDRITAWHVAETPRRLGGTATWGESRAKLLRLDESEVHILMETYVVLGGDALTPLIAAVAAGATAAGWRGVDPADGEPRGPGRVPALTGELMAVRRAYAFRALPEDAVDVKDAIMRMSLRLPGELVVPEKPLPVAMLDAERLHDQEDPAPALTGRGRAAPGPDRAS
ncbi:hypothetical protein SAMN05421874_12064 [Nonomuraea maritima]|uniref:Uncharacterized protein n=1 Tax=Nonomuraea maritima TaxID=683260 RepID=A0A1G9JHF5_9ACTN|nr:hypothetical protein SAMN05421874_12064 [Nonomuraea maritima]